MLAFDCVELYKANIDRYTYPVLQLLILSIPKHSIIDIFCMTIKCVFLLII